MKALKFDGNLKLVQDAPVGKREGEALIEVLTAGICNTDLEIVKGYAGFHGILGHEFVGRVLESPNQEMLGRRVVGEINVGCNHCNRCLAGDPRHCQDRTVLGIKGRNGTFAEFLSLPLRNLHLVPDSISNDEAIFIEPFAAACQILEQIEIDSAMSVAVMGDGKLAQLIVRALGTVACNLTVVGKHQSKLASMQDWVSSTYQVQAAKNIEHEILHERAGEPFDVVVEATGSETGLSMAMNLVRPKGTIILKSTHHQMTALDMSLIVVNEVKLIGSRCGRFHRAIEILKDSNLNLQPLISAKFGLEEGITAVAKAAEAEVMKVILEMK
jgi:threonine dehydrogenase-like Zn-dependent dehydrogenase